MEDAIDLASWVDDLFDMLHLNVRVRCFVCFIVDDLLEFWVFDHGLIWFDLIV